MLVRSWTVPSPEEACIAKGSRWYVRLGLDGRVGRLGLGLPNPISLCRLSGTEQLLIACKVRDKGETCWRGQLRGHSIPIPLESLFYKKLPQLDMMGSPISSLSAG